MLNFIILGYVPGTTLQITFDMFLLFSEVLAAIFLLAWFYPSYAIRRHAQKIAAIQLISL